MKEIGTPSLTFIVIVAVFVTLAKFVAPCRHRLGAPSIYAAARH
jgi:hypothetical protein